MAIFKLVCSWSYVAHGRIIRGAHNHVGIGSHLGASHTLSQSRPIFCGARNHFLGYGAGLGAKHAFALDRHKFSGVPSGDGDNSSDNGVGDGDNNSDNAIGDGDESYENVEGGKNDEDVISDTEDQSKKEDSSKDENSSKEPGKEYTMHDVMNILNQIWEALSILVKHSTGYFLVFAVVGYIVGLISGIDYLWSKYGDHVVAKLVALKNSIYALCNALKNFFSRLFRTQSNSEVETVSDVEPEPADDDVVVESEADGGD